MGAVLIQPDSKIVIAGETQTKAGALPVMSLVRYNADGSLDSTFGSGGEVVSKISAALGTSAAALYPDSGTANDGKIVEASGGVVARFNANGSLDSTFGSRGSATVPWSGAITGVVIQPDGKIVVDGTKGTSAFELTRFNANGTLDTTFGAGGTATLSLSSPGHASALGLQADGKLVVAGYVGYLNPGLSWELAHFNANGTLDTTFDSAGAVPGTVTTHFAASSSVLNSLAIYPGTGSDTADYGKIVAVGGILGTPDEVALGRYNANGTLDTTFGQSGEVTTPGAATALATAIQADGKVVVAGLSLLRYNTDGSLDTTFGNGGIVATPKGSGARAVAIQADGRIVAAGGSGSAGSDFLVARYLSSEPQIGSFTANPNPVTAGSSVTLTASLVTDGNPNSAIGQVAFYVDSNGDGKLDAGDTLLGYGTLTNGAWTFTFSTAGWASGSERAVRPGPGQLRRLRRRGQPGGDSDLTRKLRTCYWSLFPLGNDVIDGQEKAG